MANGRVLIKGNEALAEAAIRAGCKAYFGYPITPQTETLEYMARELPKHGGVFLQSESELGAISMVYGAAATGTRVMTSSSSPGISLMQEGLSYLASAELPVVVVNVNRGGPGLGRITPAQSDYFQATRGGGHGDYRTIVLAPASVQEMADFTMLAFDLADRYRMTCMLLCDGILGGMMEVMKFKEYETEPPAKEWAVTRSEPGSRNLVLSAPYTDQELVEFNIKLRHKYRLVQANEVRYEEVLAEDADVLIVAFGIVSRFAMTAIDNLRSDGFKVGLVRPITLWPFPTKIIRERAEGASAVLTVELNEGQMVDDVRIAVGDAAPVHFLGTGGGKVTDPQEIELEVKRILEGATTYGSRV